AHRLEAAHRAIERFDCVVLLKGEGTIVAAPGERVLVCPGFPSLATAGTGDVLTGVIGSFLAKGMDARLAAAAAATAHSEAAAEAPQRAGLIASDVIEMLPYVLGCAELWAVVEADGYGHGAVAVAAAALGSGATALCVATVAEGLALAQEFRDARIIVMGPTSSSRDLAHARDADLELAISDAEIPDGIRVHLKLDTGMGRYGLARLPELTDNVVGVMTHLATADSDEAFARAQLERFLGSVPEREGLTRHAANSAAALRLPEARL